MKYGRTFFTRYDFEHVPSEKANDIVESLKSFIDDPNIVGSKFPTIDGLIVVDAGDFQYTDLDGSISSNQGLFFKLSNGARVVLRLSGTGSSGATIRLYVENYTDDQTKYNLSAESYLRPVIDGVLELLNFQRVLGTKEPTVKT